MKIAIAQIQPVKGDLSANLDIHLHWIRIGAAESMDVIFFPELSLTGYEPKLASKLSLSTEDDFWQPIRYVCDELGVTAGLGAPIHTQAGIYIGMLIFQPGRPLLSHAKQILHPDEEAYFVKGQHQLLIPLQGEIIAPAICYESLQRSHIEAAKVSGATLYLASVAKHGKGMEQAKEFFSRASKDLGLPVLLCNCIGPADDFVAAGGSAAWNRSGQLLEQLGNQSQGLLLFDTLTESSLILT